MRDAVERAEKKRQSELMKRETERQQRLTEKRARQQKALEVKQQEVMAKAQQEAEREYERLQRLEEKRQVRAMTQARQRERVAQRVAGTLRAHADKVEQQRRAFMDKQDAEEQRRMAFNDQRQTEIAERRRKGEERQLEIRNKLTLVERRSEMRKQSILEKERSHEEMMSQVDASRERKAMVERTEKDMHFYQRQMKLARNLRREEYKRQMTAEKLQKENERAEDLAAQRRELLKQRRVMRSESSLARERVATRIDQMRSSSSFHVDETVRSYIHNPELNELLERCLELRHAAGASGADKVTIETMRTVMGQMQAEGKLATLAEARKGKTESGAFVSNSREHSQSAPDLSRRPLTSG